VARDKTVPESAREAVSAASGRRVIAVACDTGDRATGGLLGVQLFGHKDAEVAKRVDIAATAIFHGMTVDAVSDLDLSYTPPPGSPWDAVQAATQSWTRAARQH
jgi:hypothetical protein